MQLGRYQLSSPRPEPVLSVRFAQDGRFFSVATEKGYEVWRSYPLNIVRRRELKGTLAQAILMPYSPLVVLQGGGSSPVYPPNKAVIYHDKLGVAVAELEFSERIRGIAVRQGTICIATSRRAMAFQYGIGPAGAPDRKGKSRADARTAGFWLEKFGEWETAENESGLMALSHAPDSALLALPGRQPGHVQLVYLPPCPHPPLPSPSSSDPHTPTPSPAPAPSTPKPTQVFRSPIILAHTHPLSTLSCTASGSHIATTSERGTLVRIWDTARGNLERELRRGVDPAGMWGVVFEPMPPGGAGDKSARPGEDLRRAELRRKGGRLAGWSDKGTVHVWEEDVSSRPRTTSQSSGTPNLTNLLTRNLPLPRYFSSTTSTAQYRLPRKNPHAINSYVSAAAGAYGVGVPSMKIPDPADEPGDDELAERFVVGWVDVADETAGAGSGSAAEKSAREKQGTRFRFETDQGPRMGSRAERGSRESTASHRSGAGQSGAPGPAGNKRATPTSRISTPLGQRRTSAEFTATASPARHARQGSASASSPSGRAAPGAPGPRRTERQLVAVTYTGDWYRLRIPEEAPEGADNGAEDGGVDKGGGETRRKGRCELVEYRRINVGGGGW